MNNANEMWTTLAKKNMDQLSEPTRRALDKLAKIVNEYGHVSLTPKAEALHKMGLNDQELKNALDELEEVHLFRYSGKSGFLQMNPEIWPPTAETLEWAIQRWAGNMTTQKKEALQLAKMNRRMGGKRIDPSGIAD